MFVGINHPWHHCGWDFGETPRAYDPRGTERAAWKRDIDATFAGYRALGLKVVRWFVLADGTSYGVGPNSPRRMGLRGRWVARPQALPNGFEDDFEQLLVACERHGLQLLPSFVGIGFFSQPEAHAAPGIVKGARANLIEHATTRMEFLDRALEPLLAVSARHPSAVFAWEIVNEPEWVTRDPETPLRERLLQHARGRAEPVSRASMLAFIADAAARIATWGFDRTVGFARRDSLDAWDESARVVLGAPLDLTIPQFHHYPQPGEKLVRAPRPRTLLGEVATRLDALPAWPELARRGRDDLHARLELARTQGYAGVLVWSGLKPKHDRASEWTPAARNDVARAADDLVGREDAPPSSTW